MKKIISLLLVLLLALTSAFAVNAEGIKDIFGTNAESAAPRGDTIPSNGASGTYGSLSWSLTSAGALTISGSGSMTNFTASTRNSGQWLNYKQYITSATIESGVTSIGNFAFYQCNALTTVSISDTVATISGSAFSTNCRAIESFTVASGNTVFSSNGGVLFDKNQTVLKMYPPKKSGTSYTVPSTVTSIDAYAFRYASYLTSVNLSNVTSIGDYGFSNATSLTSVTMPHVTALGMYAFDSTGLTSVSIPSGVTTISQNAFSSCTSLSSVTIPNTVTTIDIEAFRYDTALTSISIPSSVTRINSLAFDQTGLTSITIPSSVTTLNGGFSGCASLTTATINGNVDIPNYLFYNCTSLTTVSIPNARTIGSNNTTVTGGAFEGCTALESITIPNTCTRIGTQAFKDTGLTSVTIPSSVTTIGRYAFSGTELTSIVVPSTVTSLGTYAFSDCNLRSATINCNGALPEYAFAYNPLDVSLTLSGVTSIGNRCFYQCGFSQITLPNTVTSIGDYAFYYCYNLINATMSANLVSIGQRAFQDCTHLQHIALNEGLTSIGYGAFCNCKDLREITVPGTYRPDFGPSNNYSGSVNNAIFQDCANLESVVFSEGATNISTTMFTGCHALKSITLPSTLVDICGSAFNDCSSITNMTIKSKVVRREQNAGVFVGGNHMFVDIATDLECSAQDLSDLITVMHGKRTTINISQTDNPKLYAYYNNNLNGENSLANLLTAANATDVDFAVTGVNHTVTLDYNNGGITPNQTLTKVYGQDLTLPTDPTPPSSGKIFVGWQEIGASDRFYYTYSYESCRNVTLTAVWADQMLPNLRTGAEAFVGNNDPIEGYDSKLGNKNGITDTWIKQSAKWLDSSTGSAQLRVDLSYGEDSQYQARDVLFVMDMGTTSSSTPNSYYCGDNPYDVINMANTILNEYEDCRVAAIAYGSYVHEVINFTDDYAEIIEECSRYKIYGNEASNHSAAVSQAYTLLNNRSDKTRDPIVIFMSAGHGTEFGNRGNGSISTIYSPEDMAIDSVGLKAACSRITALLPNMANGITGSYQINPAQDVPILAELCGSGNVFSQSSQRSHAQTVAEGMFSATNRDYKIEINLDTQRFTTNATSQQIGGSYGNSTFEISGDKIIWDTSTLSPNTEYYFTIPLQLVSNPVSGGPRGASPRGESYSYPTSLEGNSIAAVLNNDSNASVNPVRTPILTLSDEPETPVTYTLTADANGGSNPSTTGWTGTGATSTKTLSAGDQYGTLPAPTRSNYTFDGWFSAQTGGTQVSSSTTMIADDVTIYAHWTPVQAPETHYIRYYDGSTLLQETEITSGMTTHSVTAAPITNPKSGVTGIVDNLPTKTGYLFAGWYETQSAATSLTASSAYARSFTISQKTDSSGNVNLYAGWVQIGTVTKDGNDDKNYATSTLGGFSMQGVQVRSPNLVDQYLPDEINTVREGIRFVTVYKKSMLTALGNLRSGDHVNGDINVYQSGAVRYGYVLYGRDMSALADTDLVWNTPNAMQTDCTKANHVQDHRNFTNYILSTTVIKFDNPEATSYMNTPFEARAYVTYTDANGYQRVRYSTYGLEQGETRFAGGCRTTFNDAYTWATLQRV